MNERRGYGFIYSLAAASIVLVMAGGICAADRNPFDTGFLPIYGFEVIKTYPHNPKAFTQGLVYRDGVVYEGTGRRGRSTLTSFDLFSGKVLQEIKMDRQYFGEGVTLFGDKVYQLTWTSKVGFVYQAEDLRQIKRFSIPFSGWGITHDETQLILSDGSMTLHYLDPITLKVVKDLPVRGPLGGVTGLNELEYINGEILANVFPTNQIARIDPVSGNVTSWVDLTQLRETHPGNTGTLNGIAYDPETDTILITGKNWAEIYGIRLVLRYERSVQPGGTERGRFFK
ncbi:MAG: glutamine cyclotransferase [Deltaproteobacteria bacterium]|nr:MAG: glutamine cyclotransferase [Deltaproteobacteria bacterium]